MKKYLYIMLFFIAIPAQAEWVQQNSGTTADLVDVCFVDELHGWAIGNEDMTPVIIKTVDGGITWQPQELPVEQTVLNRIFFVTERKGFIASRSYIQGDGFSSHIYSTTNGGDTWDICNSAEYFNRFEDVYFIDEQRGWVAGGIHDETGGGFILATTDGGITWNTQLSKSITAQNDRVVFFDAIGFADSLRGWASANDLYGFSPLPSEIYYTEDGGENWSFKNQNNHAGYIRNIHVVCSDSIWTSDLYLAYSYNSGDSWSQTETRVYDFVPISGTSGWALGENSILFTSDSGDSWSGQFQYDSWVGTAIDCIGTDFACAVGQSGGIVTYHSDPSSVDKITKPESFTLDPNYPNPFNASTTIPYTLTTDSPVTINLYSTTGQFVQTLCDQYMPAGRHSITVDGRDLASGMYFARVQVQGRVKYTRMLLLK